MSSARLERISKLSPKSEAQIVFMRSPDGVETVRWHCQAARLRKVAAGWTLLRLEEPRHNLRCDDAGCRHG